MYEAFTPIIPYASIEHFSLGKLGKKTGKEALGEAAEAASKKAAKEAAEKAAKEAAEKSAKEAAQKATKEAAEKTAKESAEKSMKSSLKKGLGGLDGKKLVGKVDPKKALGLAGALGALGLGGFAFAEQKRKDGKKFSITSIVDSSASSSYKAKIKVSESEKFSKNDTVTLSETDSTPPLDGEFKIVKVISKTEIEISTDKKITASGTKGNMVLNTTFGNQLGSNIGNIVDNVLPEQLNPFKWIEGLSDKAGLYCAILVAIIIFCSISMSIIKFL